MSQPAKSMFVFGIYLVALGAILIVAPNLLLSLFGVCSRSAQSRVGPLVGSSARTRHRVDCLVSHATHPTLCDSGRMGQREEKCYQPKV